MNDCFPLRHKKIWVAGHRGMVGSALLRRLQATACEPVVATIDLRDQAAVRAFYRVQAPDAVILAAARVGGIAANAARPADFLYDNLMIQTNVIGGAAEAGVGRLLFLGSSCIYPKFAAQPIREEALLTGALEPTNEAYAVAKIAGVKLCAAYRRQHGCDFIAAMPCNLYGPGDRFDERDSHVIPALMRRLHEARCAGSETVTIWGTGAPLREFLHVDDLAEALLLLLARYSDPEPINVGSGSEVSIAALAGLVARAVGYQGRLVFDPSHPDGTPRKLLDSGRIRALGWRPRTALEDGLAETYDWFLAQQGLRDVA